MTYSQYHPHADPYNLCVYLEHRLTARAIIKHLTHNVSQSPVHVRYCGFEFFTVSQKHLILAYRLRPTH